jgi:hypothetical protein
MNIKLFVCAILTVGLVGCGTQQIKLVPVDKPIPMCPKPPEVRTYPLLVDELLDSDITDPGKVGQAYKHDVMILRKQNEIYRLILKEYEKTSQNFDAVKAEIDNAYKQIDTKTTEAQMPTKQ